MANLTEKELTLLEDQMGHEQTLVKKYKQYSSMCCDAQLQSKCSQLAQKHEDHYNTLLNQLN